MRANIGIEISEQYFKMAVAALQGTHLRISDVIAEPVLSLNDEQMTSKAADILKAAKVRPGPLTLSLARNLVTVRNLHLPSQDKKEIAQMIDLNVARIVPYKREEITFGSQFLGVDEMGYTKVILAIINSNVIRRQSKILEKAGLFIDKISMSSYGIWEWVVNRHRSDLNQTDLYLLLDIDTVFTDFIVFSHHNLLFTRSINMGVNGIREAGELGIRKLLGEVKQSLVTFYNEEINKKPVAAFLSGATISSELDKVVETELGMPVRTVFSPYPPEVLKAKNRTLPADISMTAVSLLALRGSEARINFMLPEIQIRKSLREKTRDLVILGSLCAYLFLVIFAISIGRVSNKQAYLNRLDENCRTIEKGLSDLLAKLGKVDFIRGYLELRRVPLVVFAEVQRSMPSDITVTGLTIDEQNRAAVRGQSAQLSDVFKFVNALEQVKQFKEVKTKSTRKKKIKEKDMTEFEITFEVKG